MKKVLVIIPAYNEEENILNTIGNVEAAGYDICVINDASRDNTSFLCKKIKNIIIIDLPFNLGIGGAVQTGYLYAYKENYDIAIQFDGDGQHDAFYIKNLILPLLHDEADMVIGSRFIDKQGFQSSMIRRLGIKFFKNLIYIIYKKEVTDTTSGFRAVNKRLIARFSRNYPVDYPEPETNAALIRMGYRIKEIPVTMKCRRGGTSSINSIKSVWYMVKVTIAICIDWLRGEFNDD